MKEKALFVASVAAVFAGIYLFQKKVMVIPVVGTFLPGGQ